MSSTQRNKKRDLTKRKKYYILAMLNFNELVYSIQVSH